MTGGSGILLQTLRVCFGCRTDSNVTLPPGAPGTAPSVVGGPWWAAGTPRGTATGTSKSSPILFQLQILPRRQTMLFLLFFIILRGWCITQARFHLGSQGLEVGLMDFMQMS